MFAILVYFRKTKPNLPPSFKICCFFVPVRHFKNFLGKVFETSQLLNQYVQRDTCFYVHLLYI